MSMDFSTIYVPHLKKLRTYKLPATYHLQKDPGNGCYGDPPGYPSYFTRSVYTQYGNTPGKGPQLVISYEGVLYVVQSSDDWKPGYEERQAARLRSLWSPLPLKHPRTQAWIRSTFTHQAKCYWDEKGEVEPHQYGKPSFFIFPVPDYKLRMFHDDARFSNEWRMKERTAIDQANAELCEKAAKLATVDNHLAVRTVRKYYPAFTPPPDLIDSPPGNCGCWWETETEQPSPDQCKPRSVGKHPINGSWCQWCGWQANEAAK